MTGDHTQARPVLLTVDDDPSVSRAVARDLRRRYGQDYRIVRAESAADALEALREIKLRGDPVAALLADYRMPDMNGIEFLEQAMDVFPRARRALLTAYADTEAAIAAINVVDVDHYLLKPWDPPEEKLYPVIDALVEMWRASGDVAVPETKLVGHRWSPASNEVRDFLARGGVPYRWFSADEPEGMRLLSAADADASDVPVVLVPGGDVLLSPDIGEVAAKVGLGRRPRRSCTTSSSSEADPPGCRPRSTRPRRACPPCWWRARWSVGRPVRAPGSRTTSASPTASPATS